MKLYLWIAALLLVFVGTIADLNLFDALDADPTEPPKVPEKPKLNDGGFDLLDAFGDPETEKPKKPTSGGGGTDGGFDLLDAFGDPETEKPKKPTSGGGGTDDIGFDLGDALGPDPNPKPDKPNVPPQTGGGGGGFDDSDLWDESKEGELKPDGGAGAQDPYNGDGGGSADPPKDPWVQVLKVLNANMPEGVYIWLANIKHSLVPLLERALQLLEGLV